MVLRLINQMKKLSDSSAGISPLTFSEDWTRILSEYMGVCEAFIRRQVRKVRYLQQCLDLVRITLSYHMLADWGGLSFGEHSLMIWVIAHWCLTKWNGLHLYAWHAQNVGSNECSESSELLTQLTQELWLWYWLGSWKVLFEK